MRLRVTRNVAVAAAILTVTYAHVASPQDNAAPPASIQRKTAPAASNQNKAAAPASNQNNVAASPANQYKTAAGFWQQSDDTGFVAGWFFFVAKKGLYEGRLVKMFKKPGAPLYSGLCEKCEGDQKDAPMLGLTIVKGMKRDGQKYDEGSILDPRDGTVYHAQMELSPDGKELSVRGYLGIPLLGQTQVWKRLPDDAMAAEDIPAESLAPGAAPK